MRRQLQGTVIKLSSKQTIVVRIDRVALHPKYKKRYKISTKYLVHDPKNLGVVGAAATIVECRPISKRKKWVLQNPSAAIS